MSRQRMNGLPFFIALGSIAFALISAAPRPAMAVEMAEQFVAKLRDRGHYEMAVYYLEQMRDSSLVDSQFKDAIDYEAGITLLQAARSGLVMGVREKQLDRAGEYLGRFVRQHPNHPRIFSARAQLANLLVERARIQSEQAKGTEDEVRRRQFAERARELLDDAQEIFAEQKAMAVEKHEQYPKYIDPSETKLIEERAQVRQNILEARLALAGVKYERALTYPRDSKDFKEQMQASADAYKELYEDYSRKMAGLYARMWEGRAYKQIEEFQHAIQLFETLLAQPNDAEPIRVLQSKVLVLYLDACLEANEYRKALDAAIKWRDEARGAEETSVEGVAIHYYGAMAGLRYLEDLDRDKPEDEKRYTKALADARKSLQFVARFNNDFQKRAREALAKLGIEKDAEPRNFVDARDRGKESLDRLQVQELTAEERQQAMADAMKYFRMALTMVDEETDKADVNIVRYYMTYLHWLQQDYYQSAVIGEFLTDKYPTGVASRQAAKIAMASYAKMLGDGAPEENQFEIDRMVRIATRITQLWPDADDAGDAWMTLVRSAVQSKDYEQAREYMEKIPESSPQRGEAELLIGRSLWAQYVTSVRKDEEDRPRQDQLDAMVAQAKEVLESGVARMKQNVEAGGQISYPLLASTLSLAQIYINQRETDKALALIEDEQIGPLTMVAADHEAAQQEAFRTETYKAALRSYVGTQQLDKAEQIMQQLEEGVTAGDEEAQARLTRIYISLGRDLEEQLDMLQKQGKRGEQREVARGFEMFLARILQRPGNTFNSLNWVGETFLGMADGMNPGGDAKLPPQAEQYYKRAIAAYQQIRKQIQANPDFAPKGASASIQIRMAKALRQIGQDDLAQKLLLLILRERPMMIDGQIECAYSYQDRGEENPRWYKLAILGSRKHEQFWGWGQLANRVANNKAYRGTFHEARYNLAWCRMKYALAHDGEEKKEWLQKAENDILVVARLFPAMGGDEWRPKYDDLLKDIQQLLGKPDRGLEVIKKRPNPDASAKAG